MGAMERMLVNRNRPPGGLLFGCVWQVCENDTHRDEDGVAEELADVAIFLLGIAHTLGYDLEKELISKIEKNNLKPQYSRR